MTTKETEIYNIGKEIRNIRAQKHQLIRAYKLALAEYDEAILEAGSSNCYIEEPQYPHQALKELERQIRQLKHKRNWEQRKVTFFGNPDLAKPISAVELMNTWTFAIIVIGVIAVIFDIATAITDNWGNIARYAVVIVVLHGSTLSFGLLMALVLPVIRMLMSEKIISYDNDAHVFKHGFIQGCWRCIITDSGRGVMRVFCALIAIPLSIIAEKIMGVHDIHNYIASLLLETLFSIGGTIIVIAKIIIDARRYRKNQVF